MLNDNEIVVDYPVPCDACGRLVREGQPAYVTFLAAPAVALIRCRRCHESVENRKRKTSSTHRKTIP